MMSQQADWGFGVNPDCFAFIATVPLRVTVRDETLQSPNAQKGEVGPYLPGFDPQQHLFV